MKKSIVNIITKKIFLMLLIAVILLFCGAYYTVSKIVYSDTKKHAQTIAGIYSDTTIYLAKKDNVPVDEKYTKEIGVIGDYMCNWYKIDAATIYVPDFKNNTVKYISVSVSDNLKSTLQNIPKINDTLPYNFTDEEIAVWNGTKQFAHINMNIEGVHELVTVFCSEDEYKNKFFSAVTTNYTKIYNQTITYFLIFAVIIAAVVLGIYFRLKQIIKKKISEPARKISETMNSYMSSEGTLPPQIDDEDSLEFSMISTAYNTMLNDINIYVKDIEELNNEKMKQATELTVASKIQQGFLQKNSINSNDYYIQCMMKPAKNVGGDLYDYIELDENHTLMVIADVSGKGITAAIIMAVTLILIREYAKLHLTPAEILEKLNETLSKKNPAMQFITAFIGVYNRSSKTFTYSNAGHNNPYIVSDKVITIDNPDGTVLGLFPNEKYTNKTIQLNTGDTIFMYTDGVTEVINDKKEFYGIKNLEAKLNEYTNSSSTNLVKDIYNSLQIFSGNAEQFDDITMLSLTIKDTVIISLDYDIKEFEKIKELILQLPIEYNEKLNLCLAAEEIFVNICNYAFPNSIHNDEKIIFALSQADIIIIRFEDGGQKFNPLENIKKSNKYDPDSQIGGLGIYLTSNIVDEIKYDYKDNKNILSLIKNCKEKND